MSSIFILFLVAPHVGAWIETRMKRLHLRLTWSHPMWVRGLKLHLPFHLRVCHLVAPHVGAWIETIVKPQNND